MLGFSLKLCFQARVAWLLRSIRAIIGEGSHLSKEKNSVKHFPMSLSVKLGERNNGSNSISYIRTRDYLSFSYREYAVNGVHPAWRKGWFVCLFCFHQLVRVTCAGWELIASESNHIEGLWQAMGRHRSQIQKCSSMTIYVWSVS